MTGDGASSHFRLGFDGGGTSCRARIADATGRVLGNGRGGPANITTDLKRAAGSILEASRAALAAAGLPEEILCRTDAVFGMAGGNVRSAAEALAAWPFPFARRHVTSDAETACIGAHAGRDGAILILGTGSQGYGRREDGGNYRVGGWGFALSDGASGAVLGQRAARRALLASEGLAPSSPFTTALMARFDDDPATMLAWALRAIPRDWAEFAPLVYDFAANGDTVAVALRAEAVGEAEGLVDRLSALGARRVALVGGLAASVRPHMQPRFSQLLVEPEGDALDGALHLAAMLWS